MRSRLVLAAVVLLTVTGCAGLGNLRALVQPPTFEQAPGQPAEIQLIGPRADLPIGGAGVRLWARVQNPNTFGITLGSLKGTLFLDERRAADADFPLGLPLRAGEDTVIPIDLSISFSDLPGLADVARRAVNRQAVPYRLDGTIGIDVERLGQNMVFGPMTLIRGETR